MGITGLLPFIEKASRRTNISEFSGCTVAIDSYCWLHKGAFACAEKLVRGEDTDVHIKYCLKYVNMLLSKNVKPILVFDGRHLPAKAMTESKRRESRSISKKRAAELLKLGKVEEARSYMRRSIDITHEMALSLIQECRRRNVDCVVAPYEADSQLAYLNIRNIAHIVITEDSDLILFGCTKVMFKMDLDGVGTLVETGKLPLVMKCPIEHYSFSKFRQMCIMSGCDYLPSLPGIGLAKARQFVTTTQDSNFANALRKLPGFFNRSNLTVTDEYRENFLKAEATFKHQYVYDPLERRMVRLTEPEDDDIEQALCVNAGELLDPEVAFQLALGNLDPFTLKIMDVWHPDRRPLQTEKVKTSNWKDKGSSDHPSIWSADFISYLDEPCPWKKKPKITEPIIALHGRPRRRIINLESKVVPETEDQDESLSIQTLSKMYCIEPSMKRQKLDENESKHRHSGEEDFLNEMKIEKSPILGNKERSYKKLLKNGSPTLLKRLSRFPRTLIDDSIVESKFFSTSSGCTTVIEDSPEKSKNPFDKSNTNTTSNTSTSSLKTLNTSIVIEESPEKNTLIKVIDSDETFCEDQSQIENLNLDSSQKENSPCNSPVKAVSPTPESSPRSKNPFVRRLDRSFTEDDVIENTYPMETLVTPVDSQESFGQSPPKPVSWNSQRSSQPSRANGLQVKTGVKRSACRVPGLKRTTMLPANQPTLLNMFGFHKKPVLKR